MAEPLADRLETRPVLDSEVVHHGLIWDVVRERVDLGGGAGEVTRVRSYTWEVPAGLLDVDGEDPWLAAARELHEEADLAAEQWHVLVDYFSSPGGLDEALRVYLARGLSHVPEHDRHEREGEELGMPLRWVDLDEAQEAVLTGRVHNPSAVVGVLAAHAARARDWATLRPHDAPWPEHPAYRVQA